MVASHLFIGDEFGFSVIEVSPIWDEFCVVMDLNSFYDKRLEPNSKKTGSGAAHLEHTSHAVKCTTDL
jgi:hypothetical protein